MGGPAPWPDELEGTPRPSGQQTATQRRKDLSAAQRLVWLFVLTVPGTALLLATVWVLDRLRTAEVAAGVRIPGMW